MPEEPRAEAPELTRLTEMPQAESRLYFNAFSVTITPADVIITLQIQDNPILTLHASHEVGKTLAIKLAGVVKALEGFAEQPFRTTDELLTAIQKAQAQDGSSNDQQ